jgi:PBSX family phage terminase large subunit
VSKPPLAVAAAMPMSDKQLLSLRQSSARVNIWEGSVRSGKTIASLMRWLIYVATTAGYSGELVVIGRTRAAVARNVFAQLQDPKLFGEAAQHVHYTPGADKATVLGRTVWVLGASDANAEAVVRGMTCAGAYVDEITVIPESFFTQLLNRLWDRAQLFGTTNPDNPAHWFKVKFLNRIGKPGEHGLRNWRTWHFMLDDNPALAEHQKASIRRENVGLWHRRYVLGEWVAAEGAVYDMWDAATMVVPWQTLPPMERILAAGVDYGTTNATAALLLGLGRDPRDQVHKLWLLDEWRHDPNDDNGRRWTDAKLSEELRTWLPAPEAPLSVDWLCVDPAAASFKVQLFNDGLRNVINAENDVAYGIRVVASLLGTGRLLVSDRCEGFITEVTGYSWDDKATAKGVDAPIKVADHSLDGGRYAIATTETNWRRSIDTLPTAA